MLLALSEGLCAEGPTLAIESVESMAQRRLYALNPSVLIAYSIWPVVDELLEVGGEFV